MVRAIGAAEKIAAGFDAVADDLASAMVALGGKGVNGAFETIEEMRLAVLDDFQRLVIVVSTHFALHNKIVRIC
jgi:hypothetical protein